MYIMLKELSSPFKINKFIYAADLFILVGFVASGLILKNLVYPDLQLFFMIYHIGIGCFMTAPSFANPQKRNIQSVIILLRRTSNRRVYHSISLVYKRNDTIKLKKSSDSK